jgi:hypothetical protein
VRQALRLNDSVERGRRERLAESTEFLHTLDRDQARVHGGHGVEHADTCQFDWHDDDRTIEAGEMKRHVGERPIGPVPARPIGRAEGFEELV